MQRIAAQARPGAPRGRSYMADEKTRRRRELRIGVIGAAVVVAALAAAAVLYAVPFGKTTYTAELAEAQSVKTGDDVRIAGISVGAVQSLELKSDRVVMKFTVDSDVFLGSETTLDVRMLTVVGGHYVAIQPAGTTPLGHSVIPADRVRLPYSLVQAFQDAAAPLAAVDGDTLRGSLDSLATSIESSPDGMREILDGVEHFIDVMNKQRSDVSAAIAIADEYLNGVEAAKGELRRLIDRINLLETVLSGKRTEVREAVRVLRLVVSRLAALQPSWESTLKPLAEQLAAAAPELENLGEKLGPVIDSVQGLTRQLTDAALPDGGVTIDQSGETVTAAPGLQPAALTLCVPLPGKAC
ncbi:MCE family protein [Nocardia huaxiensis]|uniref:MCE family protein n=1 Tax=Nocardia huaxiensis TaxID=2755382 RepID=A0A7D6VAJ4_9NOCA|nr:MlaD family protein [Nocardia huaxiensis]QLY30453.1 MCE family protein [Nocardia huaxiensis]